MNSWRNKSAVLVAAASCFPIGILIVRVGREDAPMLIFVLVAALLPYLLAFLSVWRSTTPRHWALLGVPPYLVVDVAVRSYQVHSFLPTIGFLVIGIFMMAIVAPLVFGFGIFGAWLWRKYGREGLIGWSAALGMFSVFFFIAVSNDLSRQEAKRLLNLKGLPASVRKIHCNSKGFSDVLSGCYFEVDPADFNRLLMGRKFQMRSRVEQSHPRWMALGPNFPIVLQYAAHPAELRLTGDVRVLVDAQRHQVIVDLSVP